jgi:hypothetical protein
MKKVIYYLIIMTFGWPYASAQDNVLRRVSSSIELEPFTTGYVNALGDTVIPIGKYLYCHSEIFDKIAFVTFANRQGDYVIDRKENVLFEVVVSDTKPDKVSEGLFRIKKNEKIGFANMQGEIVIEPQFDSASPFINGYAAVCVGGQLILEHEIYFIKGGKWGFINKSGKLVVPLIYDRAWSVENGKALVEKNKERISIDIK